MINMMDDYNDRDMADDLDTYRDVDIFDLEDDSVDDFADEDEDANKAKRKKKKEEL